MRCITICCEGGKKAESKRAAVKVTNICGKNSQWNRYTDKIESENISYIIL